MKCIINRKLEFSQRVYFLLKKQVTKLYQRPMCFDASTSNSHESILQEEKFQKGNTSIRLVFTGTQISTKIHTPSYVLCILPKVVEAKQVESIIF